jgi:hypothetical protein
MGVAVLGLDIFLLAEGRPGHSKKIRQPEQGLLFCLGYMLTV